MAINMRELLHLMLGTNASDLHLKAGSSPVLRVHGRLLTYHEMPELSADDTQKLFETMASEEQRSEFYQNLELDFAYSVEGVGRFRVNAHSSRGEIGLVLRMLARKIPSMEELGVPQACKSLILKRRGFVIVTGPVGSGKSTTLASMLNFLNQTEERKIVTIEDPIEYLHETNKCLICQRELGEDTSSFAAALKHALRQDLDVIMVGEMRDMITTASALSAAETGHLVLTTMQTPSAPQTVDRMIDMFPSDQQQQVRNQLAMLLEGVVYQTLVPTVDGQGRALATEVMLATPAVRNLIREGKIHQLPGTIETSAHQGMQTLDASLQNLCRAGRISVEEAVSRSSNPSKMRTAVSKGTPVPA